MYNREFMRITDPVDNSKYFDIVMYQEEIYDNKWLARTMNRGFYSSTSFSTKEEVVEDLKAELIEMSLRDKQLEETERLYEEFLKTLEEK